MLHYVCCIVLAILSSSFTASPVYPHYESAPQSHAVNQHFVDRHNTLRHIVHGLPATEDREAKPQQQIQTEL